MTTFEWRGPFANAEVNLLHAQAFETRVFGDDEWDWLSLLSRHSLGWVLAREADQLVGFANVLWDGFVHAWLQGVMVSAGAGRGGVGTELVAVASKEARGAGCEFLHVDFEPHLESFYIKSCGFEPARAGLMRLLQPSLTS